MNAAIKRGPGRPMRYKTAAGEVCPGVTTILSRFKESGALLHWAWTQGIEGKDYRTTRDNAASTGSAAHALVEQEIHGEEAVPGSEETARALGNFRKWREVVRLRIVTTEMPYISERHRFGGTLDYIALVNDELCIVDLKTSNGVYPEYICQLGAYMMLWEENNPGELLAGAHLLRIGKETAAWAHYSWGRPTMELGARLFLCLREAFGMDKELKKVSGL
jgi:hypothetical protein